MMLISQNMNENDIMELHETLISLLLFFAHIIRRIEHFLQEFLNPDFTMF